MKHLLRRVLASVLLATLVACGGGGAATLALPEIAVKILSFTPALAVTGETVTVNGIGFTKVTSVLFGATPGQFTVVSDTQLTARVPVGVSSGTVLLTLAGTGFSIQLAQALVLYMPTLTATTATTIPAGGSITVTGAYLDTVKSFTVNGVALAATSVTSSSAALAIPGIALSGALVLTDSAGKQHPSAYVITSYRPLVVTSASQTVAVQGDSVTVYGTDIDRVTSINFADGSIASIVSQSASAVTFSVPAVTSLVSGLARSYTSALVLTTAFETVTSGQLLTVYPLLTVSNTTASTDGLVTTVLITGTNMDLATMASVGGVAATVVSRAASLMTLAVPSMVAGDVVLSTAYRMGVAAGVVAKQPSVITTLSALHFVQVLDKAGSDSSLRLTPGRPVLVRALVSASAAGIASPGVSLVVSNGTSQVGTLTMAGPSTLPTSVDVNQLATTFNVTVPAAWVVAGVAFKAVVTPASGTPQTASATPGVGKATKLRIVLVPLSVNGVVAVLPSTAEVHNVFARVYPLAAKSIVVTTRAAFVTTGVASVQSTADESNLLSQLETLRSLEDPDAFYYGMFAESINTSGASGLGYQGTRGSERSSPTSAIGSDATRLFRTIDPFALAMPAWAPTMLHEIGHNTSLAHAPCGNPGALDASYPYAGGVLGANAVYNSLYADDVTIGALSIASTDAGPMTDLMGYCGGSFFSDYNYSKVQLFLEARSSPDALGMKSLTTNVDTTSSSLGYLVLSGRIDARGVSMNPAHATTTGPRASVVEGGAYRLRLTTDASQVLEYPVLVSEIADAPGSAYYSGTLTNPGGVVKVELLKQGVVMNDAQPVVPSMRIASAGTRESARAASWAEVSGSLRLDWNAVVEPFAAVTHIANDGKRTVLGLRLQGGVASINTQALAAGGRFEISFASLTSARLVTLAR